MIEKLKITASDTAIILKINELVEAVNILQAQVAILQEHAHPTATTKPAENVQDRMIGCTTLDIPKSYKNDQLTLATLDYSKKLEKENSDLKDELERTRKALDYAIDVIQTVAKMSDKLSREYGETLVEQLDNIQAYCWQEGYVLTHEEDLKKALTAPEQKD